VRLCDQGGPADPGAERLDAEVAATMGSIVSGVVASGTKRDLLIQMDLASAGTVTIRSARFGAAARG
jgi:hypothetical protein